MPVPNHAYACTHWQDADDLQRYDHDCLWYYLIQGTAETSSTQSDRGQDRDKQAQLIGLLLGLDLLISFTDLSPIQTDFSRVGGLRIVSLMFLATFHLFWFSIAWAFVSFQYEELSAVIVFLIERLNR